MATAASLTFQQLESSCESLIFEFQDGVYEDLRGRFTERYDIMLIEEGVAGLLPSFRSIPGCPDRRLNLQLLALHPSRHDEHFPLHLAIFEGEATVVERILACRRNLLSVDALACAIQNDQLAIGQFLLKELLKSGIIDRESFGYLLDTAARSNSMEFLKYLHEQGFGPWSSVAMEYAVGHGNLEMVLFMYELDPENCDSSSILEVAIDGGFIDIVKFILTNIPVNTNRYIFYGRAGAKGCLDILQLLYERQVPPYLHTNLASRAAAIAGHVNILEWMWTNYQEPGSIEWIEPVIRAGNIDVLQWLVEHYHPDESGEVQSFIADPLPVADVEIVELLTSISHSLHMIYPMSLEVAEFLHNHGVEFTPDHVELAISAEGFDVNGRLEVVKFIHENCPYVRFKTDSMNDAASVGALEIVKFLHKYRREGCSSVAMDEAIRNSHFDVVKFMCENRSEGCSEGALREALVLGDFEVAQYLVNNFKNKQWSSLIDYGELPEMPLDVFEYLLDNMRFFEDGRMFFHAVVYDNEELIKRIALRGNLVPDDVEAAIENAQRLEFHSMVENLTNMLNEMSVKSNPESTDADSENQEDPTAP
ncbi:hypothetical protein AC1031_010122 [Aphanomyces cochlioides]|nr:hypothetical protein AC1031_010122 [Aphanomyces cochlioides]